jgi:hypothetical protein
MFGCVSGYKGLLNAIFLMQQFQKADGKHSSGHDDSDPFRASLSDSA